MRSLIIGSMTGQLQECQEVNMVMGLRAESKGDNNVGPKNKWNS